MTHEEMWNKLHDELSLAGGTYIKASHILCYMLDLEEE